MAPRPVVVTLTDAEARALETLAGNSADDPEDARGVLVSPASVRAGYRALRKLRAARRVALTPTRKGTRP